MSVIPWTAFAATPAAVDDAETTAFETPKIVNVLSNDTPGDAPNVVTIASTPLATEGVAVVNTDNTITFTPAAGFSGNSIFSYTLTDSDTESSTATVTVTVAANTAPTANAGPDQTVNENVAQVQLDGSGSSDAEGTVTYQWTQTGGTTVPLSSAAAAQPTFPPPDVTANEDLVFQLEVTDGGGLTATDSVTITITSINTAPTANAGPDQTVNENVA
ncbi:MAG: PKD domain-containing protein, partial [Thiotrichales bacterium]